MRDTHFFPRLVTSDVREVGQTGSFSRRLIHHVVAAHRGSRTRQGVRWMHGIVTKGGVNAICDTRILQDEEYSLDAETKWVQKLTAGGHILTNKWKIHQEVVEIAPE
jgi:hypothetical protein